MKKYLMTGIAALTLCAGFTSCSHNDDIEPITQDQIDKAKYDQAFLAYVGGKIASNQDWGFSSAAASRVTRAMKIGETVYNEFNLPTQEEMAAAYPVDIPEGADEVSELEALYKGKPIPGVEGREFYDLDWIYQYQVTKGYNLKITSGTEASVGYYQNGIDNLFNVYVKVDGNITLKRPKNGFFNLYILKGNVTLDSNFGEMAGFISVAEGATLNDTRDHLAANDGIKLFNKGTVNTSGSYKVGNNAYIYNEGKFYVNDGKSALEYNPGAGNTPYFFNVGDDTELKASSFTIGSEGGFISDGTVVISGETKVTQAGIIWVNNGHYTTGSLIFSAKNCTFYNYCQLKVNSNTLFTDGEFNLMENSYMETQHGLFNNFIVNMYNNSGVNVTDGIMTGRQGDGTFQGFKAVNDNAKAYVRIAGTSYIPVQQEGALRIQGANMTFAYDSMKFFEYTNGINQYSTWNTGNYWGETNQAALDGKQDPRIEWNKNNVTKIFTGDNFSKVTATVKNGQCAATWTVEEDEIIYDLRIWAEDLSAQEAGDFDFNDIVLDVKYDKDNATLCLRAAGGTLPLYIDGKTEWEVHKLFQVGEKVMVNTAHGKHTEYAPVVFKLGRGITNAAEANDIKLIVEKNGILQEMKAPKGEPSCKLAVDKDLDWQDERSSIKGTYEKFVPWANDNDPELSKWWE